MKAILFVWCLLPALALAQRRADYEVHYAPRLAQEGLRVQVSVRLPQPADSTYFHFASHVWGENDLWRCLSGFAGAEPGYRFRMVPDSNRIVVHHPRGKAVRFSYRVRQDASEYPENAFNRPRVTDTYFHVLGESLFAVPESALKGPAPDPDYAATIRWVGFPQGYTLHNTFVSGARVHTFRGPVWTQFFRSLYVGGDYRIHQLPYKKSVVYVALRGQWQHYDEPRLLSTLQTAIATQRDFWNDEKHGYYTVVMSPTVTRTDSTFRGQSMKGVGVHQGFILQSSNNPFNSWELLRFMFNHEMLHPWIGGQMSMAHEDLNYWFSEGFTDYYAYKNRLRSGELSVEQWLQAFNADVIRRLYTNPERNQPNYLIKENYWKSRSFEKLPYRRGALFAFWLDNRILRKTNYTRSLDDLMRDLLRECRQPGQKFTDERFLALAQTYLHEDLSLFFQKHILGGVDIPLDKAELIEGFSVDVAGTIPVIKADAPAEVLRQRYLGLPAAAQPVVAR